MHPDAGFDFYWLAYSDPLELILWSWLKCGPVF